MPARPALRPAVVPLTQFIESTPLARGMAGAAAQKRVERTVRAVRSRTDAFTAGHNVSRRLTGQQSDQVTREPLGLQVGALEQARRLRAVRTDFRSLQWLVDGHKAPPGPSRPRPRGTGTTVRRSRDSRFSAVVEWHPSAAGDKVPDENTTKIRRGVRSAADWRAPDCAIVSYGRHERRVGVAMRQRYGGGLGFG